MPSPKLPASQHLLVIVAACSALDPVGAAELAARTGVSAKNCGLVPVFALNSGLLVKGHRRATYLPSEKGRYVARAFQRGEAEGLAALRDKWKGQWFARCIRDRSRNGPVSREALVAKLMLAARAEPERLKQAHVLIDLMVAVGLVEVKAPGELDWFEGASHTDTPPQDHGMGTEQGKTPQADSRTEPDRNEEPAHETSREGGGFGHGSGPGLQDGPDQSVTEVPRPRVEPGGDHAAAGTGSEHDLLSLLLPPVLLADLTRLSATEVLELHSHLTAVTALTAKLRGHHVI
ncbi:hypothetical protein PV409_17060 [Streptomyces sp. ME02-6979.5a]|uniref:hypothetical protein n=1 Tax=Streptomyces sp. ME02-6979.5a TaxID=462925 RepID=UPI0029A0C05B|nr:hypothetical protein [Streptomyces sp. ME02-6979.5a]MDX3339676.1 hypothetical protein [Streptomyces sp. ME02-6979.5a]